MRVRCIGRSNETVTTLSARNTVSPPVNGDEPDGITGDSGAFSGATTIEGLAAAGELVADVPLSVAALTASVESTRLLTAMAALDKTGVGTTTRLADVPVRRAALRPRIAVAAIALAASDVPITMAAAVPRSMSFFRFT
jgi:hypothetical protein